MASELVKALKQKIDELQAENNELKERILDLEACN
jgi:cell division protein FtsB